MPSGKIFYKGEKYGGSDIEANENQVIVGDGNNWAKASQFYTSQIKQEDPEHKVRILDGFDSENYPDVDGVDWIDNSNDTNCVAIGTKHSDGSSKYLAVNDSSKVFIDGDSDIYLDGITETSGKYYNGESVSGVGYKIADQSAEWLVDLSGTLIKSDKKGAKFTQIYLKGCSTNIDNSDINLTNSTLKIGDGCSLTIDKGADGTSGLKVENSGSLSVKNKASLEVSDGSSAVVARGTAVGVTDNSYVQIAQGAKVYFGTKLLPGDSTVKAIYISSQGSTIDVSTGANIVMSNGAQLNMSNGGQVNIIDGSNIKMKQGSLLKIGDVGNPDSDGDGDILIKGYHYYQTPGMEEGGSESGASSVLLSDSSIILKSYDRYNTTTTEALDPQYSLLSLADDAKIIINQLEDTQNSPKFDFTLSQIKPASTGTGSSVNVGTNVEISSDKFYVDNTIKQALQYNQGAGVLDKYKINFEDSLLIENYKLKYDSNNEYATMVDACQSISISDSVYITISGGDSPTSDQDTVISITRPNIAIEDCHLDLNDSRIQTLNNFRFYGNGGDYSLKSGTIDIDSGTVSIKENSKIDLSGGTSITGDSTKVSIKIGSNPTIDFTYADLLKLRELIDEGPQIERTVGQVVGLLGGSTNSVEGQAQEVNE